MTMLTGQDFVAMTRAMTQTISDNRDRLSTLDSAIGDGDHGVNLSTALALAAAEVDQLKDPSPAAVLKSVGKTLINQMGGAAGVIFGSFFRGGGRAIQDHTHLALTDLLTLLEGGLAAVQKRGKAQPGDKTLVDALAPAVAAVRQGVENDLAIAKALSDAAAAAVAGADQTRQMTARFGRAKFLGERSLGHQDAGATSMGLILNAWAAVVQQKTEGDPQP